MSNLTDTEISQRMTALSVLAMIAVVIIHSNTIGTLPAPASWNCYFQQCFSRLGTSWAVPFFFLQAGYWAQKTNSNNLGGVYSLTEKEVLGASCAIFRVGTHRRSLRVTFNLL